VCKVITQEYPAIVCRSIDLTDTHIHGWIRTRLAKYLAGECLAINAEPVVAYRGSTRWVQQYEPLPLPTVARKASPLRNRGVYLIIGGLGEMGLMVAEYLAQVQATIVLIDEAPFPIHDQWSIWLDTHPHNDPVSQTIQRLQALETLKAQVVVLQEAFETGEQLKQVIERIEHQYGVPRGVLHLTGGADLQTLQDLNLEDYAVRFQAKQRSLSALQHALSERSLDFCLLFSSLTGVLGGLGSMADAAISTFTDAFALKENQNAATPWISVDWEPWSTRENEQRFAGTTISRFVVEPDEGRDALSRILASQKTHIVVSTGNLLHRLQQWVQVKSEQTSSHQEFASLSSVRPPVSTAYVAPESPVEQQIVAIWQNLLGFEQIGIHDNFFELHGHSLLGMQLIARLRQCFQVNIPLTKVFEGPTVAELALVIEALIIEEIEKLDEAEAQILI
ncbi:MAG TPA: KR domain-containing protein, partial [Ktedonobacteraceae bacterium]|nr:KR domain-containing protein [Ktedonobacteraceae bacterium]